MPKNSSGLQFAACIALATAVHLVLLFSFAPVLTTEPAKSRPDGFRMIQAVVSAKPKPVPAVIKKPQEIVKKISEAAVVTEKPQEKPPEEALPIPETAAPSNDAPTAETGTGQIQTGGQVGNIEPGPGTVFLPFYKVDVKPEFLSKAELVYPRQAKSLGKEGSVIVEADIDAKGRLVDVRIIKNAGFGFDEAAIEMIKKSRFAPAYAAGSPVAVRMRFSVNFRLKG